MHLPVTLVDWKVQGDNEDLLMSEDDTVAVFRLRANLEEEKDRLDQPKETLWQMKILINVEEDEARDLL